MEKLISELLRLYLPSGPVPDGALAAHLEGRAPLALATPDGRVRAAALSFPVMRDHEEGHHWTRLCDVANELQTRFGLPAPAVSVSGADGYCLWLSLETPAPGALVREFVSLVRAAVMPDIGAPATPPEALPLLPPCLHPDTGRWSAFIHPGMGASFADGSGLEMAPPLAGQVAFLEGLHSIPAAQFADVLGRLRATPGAAAPGPGAPAAQPPVPQQVQAVHGAVPDGLLLKDATLEDIVRLLHARNIEPTFRFLK